MVTFDFSRTADHEAPTVQHWTPALDRDRDEADQRAAAAMWSERDARPPADAQPRVDPIPARTARVSATGLPSAQGQDYGDPSPEQYVDRLRERGKLVRGGPVQYEAQCPAHEDHEPSLRIRPGQDRPTLLYCHGCHASYHELLAAAGFVPKTAVVSTTTSLSHGSSDGDGDGGTSPSVYGSFKPSQET